MQRNPLEVSIVKVSLDLFQHGLLEVLLVRLPHGLVVVHGVRVCQHHIGQWMCWLLVFVGGPVQEDIVDLGLVGFMVFQ